MRAFTITAALGLAGAGLLAALAWWFGPLLPPLEPAWVRLLLAALLLLGWAGATGWAAWRRQRQGAALTAGLLGAAEEGAALRERFAEALALLRQQGGAAALNQQPWYVIIGPPGAGKTTALLNAGLTFPLAEQIGQAPLPGVGGTRLCDWWFTGQAVLIDTAGRYTTQDSDAETDRAGWQAFLGLLARTRPRQPLNGVIIAMPAVEVAGAPAALRRAHAQAIRNRITELDSRLGARLPVYLLFTKADLIAGFTEFFDDLDAERRGQVWGTTFPLPPRRGAATLDTQAAFAGLVARLDTHVAARLQAERSPERRVLIAGFPAQVASLAEPLATFITEAFGGSKLRPAPLLRGFYLASGTQEGTPVDRLTGLLSRAFGVDQRRAPSLRPVRGRSLFLHRLLAGVLPGEAMLVRAGPQAVRRGRAARAAGLGGVALATLAACGLVWRLHTAAAADQAAMRTALAGYAGDAGGRSLDPVGDADLLAVLPLLDRARELPFGEAAAAPGHGLGQVAELGAVAHTVYRHALERALLPRLVRRLEGQVAGALDHPAAAYPDFAYEGTRVYLMLGGAGPLDAGLVREWMRLDWAALGGPGLAAARDRLAGHLDALLADPLPAVALDGALVERARATFGQVPPGARVYGRIRQSAAAERAAPWRPRDVLGPLGAPLFVRASGRPLDEGVPGFLTAAGFQGVLLPSLEPAIHAVAAESWVLGARTGLGDDPAALLAVEREAVRLYEAEFMRTWDTLLADLQVMPLRSVSQAAQDLFVLRSPQSPIRALLTAVAHQVSLAEAAPVDGAAGLPMARLPGPAAEAGPGKAVTAHYRALLDLVGDGPGAPLDQALRSLTDVQQTLSKLAAAPIGVQAPVQGDPAAALLNDAKRWAPPLGRWLRAIATDAATLQAGPPH